MYIVLDLVLERALGQRELQSHFAQVNEFISKMWLQNEPEPESPSSLR